jgi:ABC-type glycerol-3-phosphate transport system substrate-binding protein
MSTHWSRRSLLRVVPAALPLAGAGALAACGVGGGEPATSLRIDRPTTVTLLLNGNLTGTGTDVMRRNYETEFRSANPNVSIDFQASGSSGAEHVTKLLALTAAGTSPDAYYLSNSGDVPALAGKGVVRALDDLIRGDAAFKREDWFDVQLTAWQLERKQRGLPWQGGPLITYYNRDLLAEAGVPAPTEATWTFDAWREAGQKLRRTLVSGETPRWATDVGGQWLHWLYAFGGDVLDKDHKRSVLNSKESLAGLQLMADFIHRDQIAPRPQDFGGRTHAQLFMDKRLAIIIMNRQGASAQGFIQPWVGVTQLPKGPAGRFSQGNIDGFAVSASTPSPAGAWAVLKWRTGDSLRREFLRIGNGGIPALKATAESPEYLNDKLPPEWNRMFIQNMSIVRLPPPIPQWPEITATVAPGIDQIKRGDVSPAAAVSDLLPKVNALLQG